MASKADQYAGQSRPWLGRLKQLLLLMLVWLSYGHPRYNQPGYALPTRLRGQWTLGSFSPCKAYTSQMLSRSFGPRSLRMCALLAFVLVTTGSNQALQNALKFHTWTVHPFKVAALPV